MIVGLVTRTRGKNQLKHVLTHSTSKKSFDNVRLLNRDSLIIDAPNGIFCRLVQLLIDNYIGSHRIKTHNYRFYLIS